MDQPQKPAGAAVYTGIITVTMTLFIAAIAARSIVAVRAGQFFAPLPPLEQPSIEMAGADGLR